MGPRQGWEKSSGKLAAEVNQGLSQPWSIGMAAYDGDGVGTGFVNGAAMR